MFAHQILESYEALFRQHGLRQKRLAAEMYITTVSHEIVYDVALSCGCHEHVMFPLEEIPTPLNELWIGSPLPPGCPKVGDWVERTGDHAPNAWLSGHPSPAQVVSVRMQDRFLKDWPPATNNTAWQEIERQIGELGGFSLEQKKLF